MSLHEMLNYIDPYEWVLLYIDDKEVISEQCNLVIKTSKEKGISTEGLKVIKLSTQYDCMLIECE